MVSINGSNPFGQDSSSWGRANNGLVAQLVERWIEDPSVGGSKPSQSTNN
jgi:hypothetical protein